MQTLASRIIRGALDLNIVMSCQVGCLLLVTHTVSGKDMRPTTLVPFIPLHDRQHDATIRVCALARMPPAEESSFVLGVSSMSACFLVA